MSMVVKLRLPNMRTKSSISAMPVTISALRSGMLLTLIIAD